MEEQGEEKEEREVYSAFSAISKPYDPTSSSPLLLDIFLIAGSFHFSILLYYHIFRN
jgi:hypothetical protein